MLTKKEISERLIGKNMRIIKDLSGVPIAAIHRLRVELGVNYNAIETLSNFFENDGQRIYEERVASEYMAKLEKRKQKLID